MYSEAQNNMTKCVDFYEKLEKDGNFCGLPTRPFREAMKYWKEYRKPIEEKSGKPNLTENEWFKQQREQKQKERANQRLFSESDKTKIRQTDRSWVCTNIPSSLWWQCEIHHDWKDGARMYLISHVEHVLLTTAGY